ncbi:MAG: hypothetical protein MJ216_00305 [Bacilli bacterium]|nr:hypothetical protein [Bacilli bacterium]
MKYSFYGSNTKSVTPINEEFKAIKDQRHLYELMLDIWCEYSCAPRMRKDWSKENITLGQCSITSFLVQDIFGGEVYGVKLDDGNFHCFNIINDQWFDLTSEQFGSQKLEYTTEYPQSRAAHFEKEEKYQRYLYIKSKLKEIIASL